MNSENKEIMPQGEKVKETPEFKAPEVVQPETVSSSPAQPVQQPKAPVKDKIDLKLEKEEEHPEVAEDLEATDTNEIDSKWVETVDAVIEKDKGKPYEEQEDSHKLSISYLIKRFGKIIKKDK